MSAARLLITGTREGWDEDHLSRVLAEHYGVISDQQDTTHVILVHGDAEGVDRQAATIWEAHGLPTEPHPADWAKHGRRAGPIRNAEMVALGAQQCLAFPVKESKGTFDCMLKASRAGIPVHVIGRER